MRDSFIFYRSFLESIKEIPEENQLQVYNAISEYALNQNEIELKGIPKAIFSLIKPQLDANNKRYENGKKGGAPKGNKNNQKSTEIQPKVNQKTTKEQPNVNDNENVNVNDNENNIYTPSEDKSSTGGTAKASKHKYGKYKNVLLKDEELQALERDYSNWKELIEYLDEYIEMKGYKAKSHYLAIKKWVIDAVSKDNKKPIRKAENVSNYTSRQYNNLDKFYDNLGGV
jgi:hypothetical protein